MTIIDIRACELDEVEERIWDSDEYLDDPQHVIKDVARLGQDVILVYSPALRITDYGLIAAEGDYCEADGYGVAIPCWSLTLIYNDAPDSELDFDNYVYYEPAG